MWTGADRVPVVPTELEQLADGLTKLQANDLRILHVNHHDDTCAHVGPHRNNLRIQCLPSADECDALETPEGNSGQQPAPAARCAPCRYTEPRSCSYLPRAGLAWHRVHRDGWGGW